MLRQTDGAWDGDHTHAWTRYSHRPFSRHISQSRVSTSKTSLVEDGAGRRARATASQRDRRNNVITREEKEGREGGARARERAPAAAPRCLW
eukprot:972334-Prymnesium_polylepis.1